MEPNEDTQRFLQFHKNISFVRSRGRMAGEDEAKDARCSPYGIALRHLHMCVWVPVTM
jgi:hypothetical protein